MQVSPPADPTKTIYGEISPDAPAQLRVFSFLIGKWEGKGGLRLADGTHAQVPSTWIGRYVLGGTAIADELHSVMPGGGQGLGITLRQYQTSRQSWLIEFLNVTGSFLRRQVNAESGAVRVDGRNVTVIGAAMGLEIREHYLVADDANFTYRMDVSSDGGKTWDTGQVEMIFRRVE
jgi:hypothetical protein